MYFIELTFYFYDKAVPEKSRCTGKKFWQKITDISRFTAYRHLTELTGDESRDSSTKIMLNTGEIVEVCETVEEIVAKIKKSKI